MGWSHARVGETGQLGPDFALHYKHVSRPWVTPTTRGERWDAGDVRRRDRGWSRT
jgi:hypothetical protein